VCFIRVDDALRVGASAALDKSLVNGPEGQTSPPQVTF
jgi:hypothetical protein